MFKRVHKRVIEELFALYKLLENNAFPLKKDDNIHC